MPGRRSLHDAVTAALTSEDLRRPARGATPAWTEEPEWLAGCDTDAPLRLAMPWAPEHTFSEGEYWSGLISSPYRSSDAAYEYHQVQVGVLRADDANVRFAAVLHLLWREGETEREQYRLIADSPRFQVVADAAHAQIARLEADPVLANEGLFGGHFRRDAWQERIDAIDWPQGA